MENKLKIALIGNGDPFSGLPSWIAAIWKGLSTLGTIEYSNPNLVLPNDFHKFDMIVCGGARGKIKDVIDAHKDRVPVIIHDLGYIDRNNYHQFCLSRLNNIENMYCDTDRLHKLNFHINEADNNNPTSMNSDHVFFVQKVGDAQHGMGVIDTLQMLDKWKNNLIESGISDEDIYIRPHPLCQYQEYPLHKNYQFSNFDEIKKAYTYNSTSCIELLRQRVPVQVLDVNSIYYRFSDREDIPTEELVQFFSKLSYSQWNKEEVATGEVFTRLYNKFHNIVEFNKENNLEPIVFEDYEMYIHENALPLPTEEIAVTPEQKDHIESSETIQAFNDRIKGLKFFELKKVVKNLTGLTPKNKQHADSLIASHFNKI